MSHWSSKVPAIISSNEKFLKYRRRVLAKPPTISNWYRTFTVFGKASAAIVAFNIVFYWDFGHERHIFSGIREKWNEKVVDPFFKLSEDEMREYLAMKSSSKETERLATK